MTIDVLVCGAGVAGLSAACALGALGLRVLVVDKQSAIRPVAKGEVLQPSALPVLRTWGALSRLDEQGALRLSRLTTSDKHGTPLLTIDYSDLLEGRQHLLAQEYPGILRALSDSLPASVSLRRNTVVGDLITSGGRIIGAWLTEHGRRYQARAGLVVAADGISSPLRKAIGITGTRYAYPHRLATFEVCAAAATVEAFTAYRSPRGLRLVYPIPGDRLRVYVQVEPGDLRGQDSLRRWYQELVSDTPALEWLSDALPTTPRRPQVLPVSRFLTPRMIVPGLALVGDAAHVVHPMAAQGLGCAVADARALAGHVAEHYGEASNFASAVDQALPAYQTERMPALVHNQRMSHRAAQLITTTSPALRRFSGRALRRTADNPRLLHLMAYNMSGLGIRPLSVVDRMRQFGLLPHDRRPEFAS